MYPSVPKKSQSSVPLGRFLWRYFDIKLFYIFVHEASPLYRNFVPLLCRSLKCSSSSMETKLGNKWTPAVMNTDHCSLQHTFLRRTVRNARIVLASDVSMLFRMRNPYCLWTPSASINLHYPPRNTSFSKLFSKTISQALSTRFSKEPQTPNIEIRV